MIAWAKEGRTAAQSPVNGMIEGNPPLRPAVAAAGMAVPQQGTADTYATSINAPMLSAKWQFAESLDAMTLKATNGPSAAGLPRGKLTQPLGPVQ